MFGDCLDFFAKKVALSHIYKNQFSRCIQEKVSIFQQAHQAYSHLKEREDRKDYC